MLFSNTSVFFLPERIILTGFPCLISSSAISCRQFPQGGTGSSVNSPSEIAAIASAAGFLPGYPDQQADNAHLSAQVPDGNAAFSTFEPETVSPVSSRTAAPTRNPEYGA